MAVGFTYLVHSLKGTPEPFLSTLPTMVIAPPAFVWLAWKRQLGAYKLRKKVENRIEGVIL